MVYLNDAIKVLHKLDDGTPEIPANLQVSCREQFQKKTGKNDRT